MKRFLMKLMSLDHVERISLAFELH